MKTASAPRVSGVTAWFSPAQKPLALCASSPAAGHAPMIAAPKVIAMASFIATRARGFRAPGLHRLLPPAAAGNGKRLAAGRDQCVVYPNRAASFGQFQCGDP